MFVNVGVTFSNVGVAFSHVGVAFLHAGVAFPNVGVAFSYVASLTGGVARYGSVVPVSTRDPNKFQHQVNERFGSMIILNNCTNLVTFYLPHLSGTTIDREVFGIKNFLLMTCHDEN